MPITMLYAGALALVLIMLSARTILLVARLAHGFTFAFAENFPPGRFIGAIGSQLVVGVAGLLCLWHGFQAL